MFFCSSGYAQVDEVVPFSSSNLPIVVINTGGQTIPDEPKIIVDMGIIDNGAARNNVSDPFNNFSGKIGIEIRGSSSQMFPKKQYGFETVDEQGEGVAVSLLGMPEEEDWILFAPYNDKTLMRDALAYGLARQLGGYAPRTKYCEVVLNGVYQGVYVLIEKIKRDKNRVNINKLDPDEVSGNNLTGGYIFKIDKFTGGSGEGWHSGYAPTHGTSQTIYFQYETPDPEDMVPVQAAYIESYVKSFEDNLASSNFDHPVDGYEKYIDVNSFIDYFIMQELTKNVDGYRLSTFMYKKRDSDGGKIFMGPVWDFNLGFGNANYCTTGTPTGFVTEFNKLCPADTWLIPFWWKRLFQDPAFGARVGSRWAELRATTLQKSEINGYIDSVYTLLNAEAQQRNFIAWKVQGKYIWPNYYVGAGFIEEVNWMKQWVSERLDWLDQNLPVLITDVETESVDGVVTASPNPFTSEVNFTYSLPRPGVVNLRIFDAMGRVVDTSAVEQSVPGEYTYTWHARTPQGMFYYQVRQGGSILGSGKLIKR